MAVSICTALHTAGLRRCRSLYHSWSLPRPVRATLMVYCIQVSLQTGLMIYVNIQIVCSRILRFNTVTGELIFGLVCEVLTQFAGHKTKCYCEPSNLKIGIAVLIPNHQIIWMAYNISCDALSLSISQHIIAAPHETSGLKFKLNVDAVDFLGWGIQWCMQLV